MLTTRPRAHLPPRAGFISALGAAVDPSAVVSAPVRPMAGGFRPRLRADGARLGNIVRRIKQTGYRPVTVGRVTLSNRVGLQR